MGKTHYTVAIAHEAISPLAAHIMKHIYTLKNNNVKNFHIGIIRYKGFQNGQKNSSLRSQNVHGLHVRGVHVQQHDHETVCPSPTGLPPPEEAAPTPPSQSGIYSINHMEEWQQ